MKTGGNVDFNQPRLQLGIQQNVEAKQLEAGIPTGHIVLEQIHHRRLGTHDGLDHQILNFFPDN